MIGQVKANIKGRRLGGVGWNIPGSWPFITLWRRWGWRFWRWGGGRFLWGLGCTPGRGFWSLSANKGAIKQVWRACISKDASERWSCWRCLRCFWTKAGGLLSCYSWVIPWRVRQRYRHFLKTSAVLAGSGPCIAGTVRVALLVWSCKAPKLWHIYWEKSWYFGGWVMSSDEQTNRWTVGLHFLTDLQDSIGCPHSQTVQLSRQQLLLNCIETSLHC